jgi:hypothetical protein
MGYTTRTKIQHIMAQSLTSATDTGLTTLKDLISIGNEIDSNLISEDVIEQYISWADEEINAALSVIYKVPFCENIDFETKLVADIDEYNQVVITERSCPFNLLDTILIVDSTGDYERHEIAELLKHNAFETIDTISINFAANTSRVLRIKYPDPIVYVATRLAAANIYDKYFASQSDPNITEYGKYLRQNAIEYLNNIVNGRTVLHGQHRIGFPFVSPYLKRRYGLEGNDRFGDRNIESKQ